MKYLLIHRLYIETILYWFTTFFHLLHTFSNVITGIRGMVSNAFFQAHWLSQRDVTELHEADNALTCLATMSSL